MDINLFGAKELYDVYLKATYPIEIKGKRIEEGEIVAAFDKIQLANFQELKDRTTANGGFDNRAHVTWETTQEIRLNFSQGVFSKVQLALLGNSDLVEVEKSSILISKRINVESDEAGKVQLEQKPEKIFVYGVDGNKVEFSINEKEITVSAPYTNLIIDYTYYYDGNASNIKVGRRLVEGFLYFTGKTRFKDDSTGKTTTGIITIPKLKLMSDLSMRLGANASPITANFSATGYPVGVRGSSVVMDLYFLEDDIDSDIQ